MKFSEVIEKLSVNTTGLIKLSKCHVMWRHIVSTWRHEVTEMTIYILACRGARKMIFFLFLWYFEPSSSKLLLIFYFCDAVTSWRHVMTSQIQMYLYQLVDVLESWFFLFSWYFRSLNFKMLLIFHLCDALKSWHHVMTSCHDATKPDLPSSACRCARKLILFLFPWFFRSLSSKML